MKQRLLFLISLFVIQCSAVETPGELTFSVSAANEGGSTGGTGGGINVNPSTGLTTTEAGGSATFAVNLLKQPTSDVTVTIATNDNTEGWVARTGGICDTSATAASGSCTLTFTSSTWANAQNVSVIGQDESIDDGDISYTLTLTASSSDPAYASGVTATVTLSNTDNDTAGFEAAPSSGLITRQDGLAQTIQVRLNAEPTSDVSFTLQSNDTTKGQITTPAGGTFTFTNANWNTYQNLVVTGQASSTGAYKIILQGSVTSADPAYAAVSSFLGTGLDITNFSTSTRRIFVTSTAYNGNLGGIAGADTKCNADANKPAGGQTYKAMIVNGTTRRACNDPNCTSTSGNNIDWALKTNTPYIRPDGTNIKTTNSGAVFTFNLSNAISSVSGQTWTGMRDDWTTSTSHCTNWSTDSNGGASGTGARGDIRAVNSDAIDDSQFGCDDYRRLYCAEQ